MIQQEQAVQTQYLEIFKQENWQRHIPKKYIINSHTFQIDQEDAKFLIDDCTNPDYSKLKIKNQINDIIKNKLNGQAFLKIYGRTGKDINSVNLKILNAEELTMAFKMSQFFTQVLEEELEAQKQQTINNERSINIQFTLRQFKEYLQEPYQQFRLYLINGVFVGMCQKVLNHISSGPSQAQIEKAEQVASEVLKSILKMMQSGKQKKQSLEIQICIDCFILQSGKKSKILSIQPIYPLNCLSLFSEEQLKISYSKIKQQKQQSNSPILPLIKYVKNQSQYKQVDLNNYRVGAQLSNMQALEQWKKFIKGK